MIAYKVKGLETGNSGQVRSNLFYDKEVAVKAASMQNIPLENIIEIEVEEPSTSQRVFAHLLLY